MKPNLILAVTFLSLTPFRLFAETPVDELMRDALYAEEVTRDADAAAKGYSEIVSRHEAQRNFAAAALFRLAELRKKQGRKDEAVSLYQKLLKEFPQGEQSVPARDALAALGGKLPEIVNIPEDAESMELARIRNLEKTSPDIANGGSLLTAAARANQLRVVTYLLERGANPNVTGEGVTGPTTPLGMAASNGNLAMAEAFIKAGASVEEKGDHTPMFLAIDTCRPKIIELLLNSGLDVNKPMRRGGPPLLMAIARGYQPTVDLLLDSGADVNAVAPEENVSALHMAVFFENAKLVGRLVKMGANPSLAAKVKWKSYSAPYSQARFQVEPGDTPLMVAAGRGNTNLLEMMLPKATEMDPRPLLTSAVNWEATGAVSWLIGKGADPNATTAEGMPLILLATKKWNPALIKALLDHGADPNVMFTGRMVPPNVPAEHATSYRVGTYSALRIAAGADISENSPNWPRMEVFRTLLDGGAKPDEEWLKGLAGEAVPSNTPSGTTHEMRQLIARRFVIPALTERPAVTLVTSPFYRDLTLLQPKNGEDPLEMARLLLLPHRPLNLAVMQSSDQQQPATSFIVWRKNADGKVVRTAEGVLDQPQPFPALQWGDVLELHHKDLPDDSTNFTFRDGFPEKLSWQLQKRISFPVNIEVSGKPETYQMRGDRFAFDPTKKELPWNEINKIGKIFRNPTENWEKAIVSRRGWSDIELDISDFRIWISTGPASGEKPIPFYLQPGDAVRFVASSTSEAHRKDEAAALKRRMATLRVESPGLPARRNYHLEQNGTPIPAPTLIETVADILSSRFAVPAGTPPWDIRLKSKTPLRLGEPEVIWNHPDLSNLRIRRLNGDGAEEIIKVDLNAIIASSKATETPEEARRKDIQLQGGDILEIPLKGDSGGGWTGLNSGQADFLAKVLDCRLQFLSEKQEVELREMRYRPLSFRETEGGKYPFLPAAAEGTFSSTRVFDMLWMKNSGAEKLARNGKTYHKGQSWGIFARDGDQISWIPIDYNEILKGTTPKPPVIPPAPTGK